MDVSSVIEEKALYCSIDYKNYDSETIVVNEKCSCCNKVMSFSYKQELVMDGDFWRQGNKYDDSIAVLRGECPKCEELHYAVFAKTEEGLAPATGTISRGSRPEDSEKPAPLVIKKGAFSHCEDLEQVVFEPGSALEEVSEMAFKRSGIKSFVAPPSLRRIGGMTFRDCRRLNDVRLNENIRELGWLCFWGTGMTDLKLPPQIEMTPE